MKVFKDIDPENILPTSSKKFVGIIGPNNLTVEVSYYGTEIDFIRVSNTDNTNQYHEYRPHMQAFNAVVEQLEKGLGVSFKYTPSVGEKVEVTEGEDVAIFNLFEGIAGTVVSISSEGGYANVDFAGLTGTVSINQLKPTKRVNPAPVQPTYKLV